MNMQNAAVQAQQGAAEEQNVFRGLNLSGKFMAMDKQDYPCIVDTISDSGKVTYDKAAAG